MSLKKQALAYALKGWPVFPCVAGESRPACKNGVKDATTDLNRIINWWDAMPTANIGFHCGAANIVVIDYDNGSDREAFRKEHNLPDTLTVSTPSGGTHEYYSTDLEIPPSVSKVAYKIDVRCTNSYVLLPPSSRQAGVYRMETEGEIAGCPVSLSKAAMGSKSRVREDGNRKELDISEDSPENTAKYVEWLESSNLPEEGERNHKLAATGAMGWSHALSEDKTIELIAEHWNVRLSEPLEQWELEQSGRSGHRSASSPWGNMTAEFKTKSVTSMFKPRQAVTEDIARDSYFRIVNREGMNHIKPPQWLIDNMLVCDSYAMLFGAPGSYKTFFALDLALSVAAGKPDCYGFKVVNSGPTLFVAGEGRSSLTKRVKAWEQYNGFGEVSDFYLADPVPLVSRGFDEFIAEVKAVRGSFKLVVLDTVGRSLAGQNENSQETASALTLQIDTLRRELGCTVLALHHTGHAQQGQSVRERGSSVFRADADTVLSLADGQLGMAKQKDAELWEEGVSIEAHKVGDSIVTRLVAEESGIVKAVKEQAKMSKKEQDQARVEAAALSVDSKAADLMSKMPIGKHFTQNKAAEFLAVMDPGGVRENTWRTYLSVLRTFDTETRKYYNIERQQWVNR